MNIPHSTITPFGYTGIPSIGQQTNASNVLAAISHAIRNNLIKMNQGVMDRFSFQPLQIAAMENGAYSCHLRKLSHHNNRGFVVIARVQMSECGLVVTKQFKYIDRDAA